MSKLPAGPTTNKFLERFMADVNEDLGELEGRLIAESPGQAGPPVFVVGLQRSGTTVLNQLILKHLPLFYPNNMLARFWKAPVVGTLLSQVLRDYMLPGEDLKSNLGYTEGIGGSHEFGYFWRQFFPTGDTIDREVIDSKPALYARLKDTLRAMSGYSGQPLLFKNIVQLALNMEGLHHVVPDALFIEIRRDAYFVAQSTYLSRKQLHGHEEGWFGIVPKGIEETEGWTALRQVAWQIRSSERQMAMAKVRLPSSQLLSLLYEDLVANPVVGLEAIANFLASHGLAMDESRDIAHIGPLPSGNTNRLEKQQQEELEKWLSQNQ